MPGSHAMLFGALHELSWEHAGCSHRWHGEAHPLCCWCCTGRCWHRDIDGTRHAATTARSTELGMCCSTHVLSQGKCMWLDGPCVRWTWSMCGLKGARMLLHAHVIIKRKQPAIS